MIYAHMSNYRTAIVRLVNKCQKTHYNHPPTFLKLIATPCIPVHAANSTGLEQPATGRNARPRRNLAIPVAAHPARLQKKHVTAAATDPVAGNPAARQGSIRTIS